MKKGWLAVGVLAGMVALALWHVSALGGLTGSLTQGLRAAQSQAAQGNWAAAERLTGEAAERWAREGLYLHVTLDHKTTDDIAVGFAETLGFLRQRDEGEYAAANAQLMERLRLLGEAERPSLENLL